MRFTELRYQDPITQTYLGSPSLVRLPGGDLLATHDYFGPGAPLSHEGIPHLSSVYRSADNGATWTNLTHVAGTWWSTLFVHGPNVYLLGVSQEYGSIVIRCSQDGGATWSHPAEERSGLLFRGGPRREPPNYHCAPTPVLLADGRLYKAFEDCDPPVWGSGFRSLVISADADANLLDATNWTMSNKLRFDPAGLPADWGPPENPGWLEGNVVQAPDGALWNILRVNSRPAVDKAALVKIEDAGRRLTFDPQTGFIQFPGGMTKFTIRRDPVTGLYLTLSNNVTRPAYATQRNVLSLHASRDLRHWQHVCTLLEDDSPLSIEESIRLVGFQYVDWQFDGEDLFYLVRTAYGSAHNYHDSNRITFHRLEGFRQLLGAA